MIAVRIVVLVAVLLASCSKSEPPQPTPATQQRPAKDPEAARRLIAAGSVVLDVRTADEYAEEHLPGAINVPVQELSSRLGEIDKIVAGDKARSIVVYCGTGARAGNAKAELEAAGYGHVVNGGGLDDLR